MMPSAMENVGHPDGSGCRRHFDPRKQRVIIHNRVGQQGFINPAPSEIERRGVIERSPGAHGGK